MTTDAEQGARSADTSARCADTTTRRPDRSSRRALALVVALALPALSACRTTDTGFADTPQQRGSVQLVAGVTGSGASATPGATQLDDPHGVLVYRGFRYVADTGHHRVLEFSPTGVCVIAGAASSTGTLSWCDAGGPTSGMQAPTALAADAAGDLFVADPAAHTVWMVDVHDTVTAVAGNGKNGSPQDGALATSTSLSAPSGLAVSPDGNQLFIADAGAREVLVVDTSLVTSHTAPMPIAPPALSMPTLSSVSTGPTFTPPTPTASPRATGEDDTSETVETSGQTSTDEPTETSGDPSLSLLSIDAPEVEESGSTEVSDETLGHDGEPSGDKEILQGDDAPQDDGAEEEIPQEPTESPSTSGSASQPVSSAGRLFVYAGTGATRPDLEKAGDDASVAATDADLASPTGLFLLPDGRLVVADPAAHRIDVVDAPEGNPWSGDSPQLSVFSDADEEMVAPTGVAVLGGADGDVLLATDADRNRLMSTPLADGPAAWVRVAGRGDGQPGSTQGDSAAETELEGPAGLAVDTSTSVLVADAGNNRVLAVTPIAQGTVQSSATATASATPSPASSASVDVPASDPGGSIQAGTTTVPASRTAPGVTVPGAGGHRMAGAGRIATSVAVSQQVFTGASASRVVVASSASYADSLAGARLASAQGAPLLLTGRDALDAGVAEEVRRVLAPGGTVEVLGGEQAVSAAVVTALHAVSPAGVERVMGDDRYSTATAIAARVGDSTGTAPIYLVSGTNYPDGLVVGALARVTGGVVVLTDGAAMPPTTRAYLVAHDPGGTRTVPVGGPAAAAAATLGPQAARAASAAAIVGADRYQTARMVAERYAAADSLAGRTTAVVGLATGADWPDALTGSAAMGNLAGPLLLTRGAGLDASVTAAFAALGTRGPVTTGIVFGGTDAVPTSVLSAFTALLGR